MPKELDRETVLALEAERWRRGQQGMAAAPFDFESLLFPGQVAAFRDRSRFQAWPWGRRAGKTDLAEKLLLRTARTRPGTRTYYVSTSIKRAVDTVWDELVVLNQDHKLGGVPNVSKSSLAFPNGSRLIVTGVDNKAMANDLRGRKKVAAYFIDEAQDWADDLLSYFYEKVVFPSLADVRGCVVMAGTGGPPRGFWYRAATVETHFSRHTGLPFDNPFLAAGEARALIDQACKDRGCDENDPSIQREFYAQFVADLTRQIFPYEARKNGYHRGELPGGTWQHVVAADFGTVDATGVVVWGWTDASPHLWLVERSKRTGLGASGQVALVRDHLARYEATLVGAVGDPGGGGAALMVDLQQGRDGVAVEAAEKAAKPAACMLMRDALRTGQIKLPADDLELLADLQTPEWDPDNVGGSIRGHMPDLVDAMLYGFRKARALNWYEEPVPPAPTPTAAEAMAARWEKMDEREEGDGDWADRDWK